MVMLNIVGAYNYFFYIGSPFVLQTSSFYALWKKPAFALQFM